MISGANTANQDHAIIPTNFNTRNIRNNTVNNDIVFTTFRVLV